LPGQAFEWEEEESDFRTSANHDHPSTILRKPAGRGGEKCPVVGELSVAAGFAGMNGRAS
jgi:hypothetical protein